jgi:hypothetical protein
MPGSVQRQRLRPSRRACLLALVTVVCGLLMAGCGGSAPSATETASGANTSASTVARAGDPTANESRPATRGSTTSATTPSAGGSGPLAFSSCMRANGVPNFPDPAPDGGIQLPNGLDPSSPAFQAARSNCEKLVPTVAGGPANFGATTHPSAQTLEKIRNIAVCMRAHRISQFPDPRTTIPSNPAASGAGVISDFDGAVLVFPSTVNLQAPAYKQALAACGAPPLGLPHNHSH